MLVYLKWRAVSPFFSKRKKDGAQIYNEIRLEEKNRAKGDILIVSQENFSHYITAKNYIICLPAHIIGLGLAIMALIMNNKLCKNLV